MSVRNIASLAASTLLVTVLGGCPWPNVPVPAGGIAGEILWDGKPAPGRTVTLVKFTSSDTWTSLNATAVSDRSGYYQFQNLEPGTYGVLYVADALPGSNEFLWWRSAPANVGSAVPSFDVAYNDVIYPPISAAIGSPVQVTLFWSSARMGNRYRVSLYATPNGYTPGTQVGNTPTLRSDWVSDLHFTMQADNVAPGNYAWGVEVDGGDRGFGSSKLRSLIVNAP